LQLHFGTSMPLGCENPSFFLSLLPNYTAVTLSSGWKVFIPFAGMPGCRPHGICAPGQAVLKF
ncbi:hypothetical protein, partial [Undibacterium sp. Ren11W]|uniref:hypothetical protein n=1 Tax=Undibacterium sp. Ren11W TaxID=3413045 RepID=UPI003BF3B82C